MNYESMSAHDLVLEIYYAGAECLADRRQEAESALRRAFIREASVGTMTKTMRQKGSVEWNVPDKRFHEGVYDLIPKETP